MSATFWPARLLSGVLPRFTCRGHSYGALPAQHLRTRLLCIAGHAKGHVRASALLSSFTKVLDQVTEGKFISSENGTKLTTDNSDEQIGFKEDLDKPRDELNQKLNSVRMYFKTYIQFPKP